MAQPDPPTDRPGPAPASDGPSTRPPARPVGTLRGARVAADPVRVGHGLLGLLLAASVASGGALFVTGARSNSRAEAVHDHGMTVAVTVTSCSGLLGGSGSNGAGYTCRGNYRIGGRTYNEVLPDNALHAPGSVTSAVTTLQDPGHLTSVADARHARGTARVYILPGVLVGAPVLVGAVLLARRRRSAAPPAVGGHRGGAVPGP